MVDKNLSCLRIKLSYSQAFVLDGVETEFFLLYFAQQLRRKNADVRSISFFYLTPPVLLHWFRIRMLKSKKEETESFSKFERQKLQRLYIEDGAANGSVRNLVKPSNMSLSKVRIFLHSVHSYKKFTPATSKFKKTKAFAIFRNKIWCVELAYIDKRAKDSNGVKYLLVRQDLFHRIVDAKGKETKSSRERFRSFLTTIAKMNRSKKIWVDKGTQFAGEFKKLCKAEGIQVYSIMSETMATFAARIIRSLKNILYYYMEDNG